MIILKASQRVEAFIRFCIDYQITVSIILWLLIIMAGVALWRLA